ncbi:16S rRNA (adenine(1518)-N(6)/adenine(1519)-N(6))-dimethyltransferase RsmA [Faecalibaculum rodentium]|uniref:16S rRNA (adenine(1518)-N(6)/adenine(1519)-N(6))- dimethyltransferase RsmA n=1 Tax=Faecalibaculum rodentium TaxID=1702221 RepID=UPI0023F41AA4|nr:16S rRNA (adenine(1518)-N(6)/adenine(1519)-N(6))-dimethyltransferase RsmA [Faecalibaculum rodentium]
MQEAIATVRRTREIQDRYGLQAKKKFGQNFITEPGVVEKIARSAIDDPSDLVFEIGPGIGALTQFLCEKAQKVVAFEVDPRLPEILQAELGADNLTVILQDFLEAPVEDIIDQFCEPGQKVRFASNLPYYITTPILFRLFESSADIASVTAMMQKEVADRFTAGPGSPDYNALSVITRYRTHVRKVMDVSRQVFSPRPNVDSAVVRFDFIKDHPVRDEKLFIDMVKACFVQRRKTISNNLRQWLQDKELAAKILEKAGIDPAARAQNLDLETFIRLYEENYEDIRKCKGESRP